MKKINKIFIAIHILFWIVFILGTVFAFVHSDIMKGDYSELQRSLQGMKDYFIWMMLAGVWFFLYMTFVDIMMEFN